MKAADSCFAGLLVALSMAGAAISAAEPSAEKALPANPPAAKKVFELPDTGRNLPRERGGWLNVHISGSQMVLKFFDDEKKPVAPDVAHGWARFRYASKSDMERTVLNREGDTLVSPGNVRPPHNFFVTFSFRRATTLLASAWSLPRSTISNSLKGRRASQIRIAPVSASGLLTIATPWVSRR